MAGLTANRVTATVVVAICTYETAAIVSGRIPTITAMCRRRRWIEVVLLAALAVHLHDEAVRAAARRRRT